jgi:mRNA-degrading endonuclease RelE of RelBE toxin-antitoxin system
MCQLETSQTYLDHFLLLPKADVPLIQSKVDLIRENPKPDAKNKKALKGTDDPRRYRVRAGNYRVVYSFDAVTVSLWDVDARDEVYWKLRDGTFVKVEVDVLEDGDDETIVVGDAVEPQGDLFAPFRARMLRGPRSLPGAVPETITVRTHLPAPITPELLLALRVPPQHHRALLACISDGDLIDAIDAQRVPQDLVERIFNAITEPDYARIAAEPRKQIKRTEDLTRFHSGELIDFQVALDDGQKEVARSLASARGSWLLKGGAGSGKSTVLMDAAIDAALSGRYPRILYTTYTRSLTAISERLLSHMTTPEVRAAIEIIGIEQLAARYAPGSVEASVMGFLKQAVMDELGEQGMLGGMGANATAAFVGAPPIAMMTWDYLHDEIEKYIVGYDLPNEEAYLGASRHGRVVPLTSTQRRAVWRIHTRLDGYLTTAGISTWGRRRRAAASAVASRSLRERYDAVFVDEAQDLDPNGIRLALELARGTDGRVGLLVLAADDNQSIYGHSLPWRQVHKDLQVSGRTRTLSVNHRTTQQIALAAQAFLGGASIAGDDDGEVSDLAYPQIGPKPQAVVGLQGEAAVSATVVGFLRSASAELGRSWDVCAIVIPYQDDGRWWQQRLQQEGIPASFMAGNDVDLGFEGVKILTRHAAKGLGFPVVAVPLPRLLPLPGATAEQKADLVALDRRATYVAMTRAMRSLLVTFPVGWEQDPRLAGEFAAEHWEITRA